jgi:ribosomal protein L21E
MKNFQNGDNVRIRIDSKSQFRGRTGTITEVLNSASGTLEYNVKIDYQGLKLSYRFSGSELEAVTDK